MTEKPIFEKKLSDDSLTRQAIAWSQEWGAADIPSEIAAEMQRIEDKAKRILNGSSEVLTSLEVYYMNNKDNEIF